MMKIIRFEWKRMMHSVSFYISLLTALIIVILDALSKYELYKDGYDVYTSVFIKWIGTFRGMDEAVYLFSLLPLLTTLAYSWTVGYDRNIGYVNQILSRTSRKKYFLAKYIVSFISGGIVFAFAILMHFLMISTFYPSYYPIVAVGTSSVHAFSFCPQLFYTHPLLFLLAWTGIAFLWGGAMVCIALGVGMLTKKYTVALISTFLTFTVQQIIGTYIILRYNVTINGRAVGLVWSDMLYAAPLSTNYLPHLLTNIAVIIIIPSLFFALRGRKYECL